MYEAHRHATNLCQPSNTKSRYRSAGLRLVVGSVVAGLMLGLSAGAAPAYAQDRVTASTIVKSEHVQGIESDLVSAFFKAAAGKGAGFIFDQLVPNADAQKLDEICDQLKELSAQVKALQISIAEIEVKNDKYEYAALYGKFQTYRNHVIELNNNLQLIGSAASRLAAAKVAYDKDPQHKDKKVTKEYQDAQSNLAGRKTNFYQEGKEQDPLGNVQSIRELLYPETGNDTIVDAYGQCLMGTNHIVNADSSAALRKVYDTLEQVQALAAFMQAEFIIAHTPKGGDPNEELAPATAKFKADIDFAAGDSSRADSHGCCRQRRRQLRRRHRRQTFLPRLARLLQMVVRGPRVRGWSPIDHQLHE